MNPTKKFILDFIGIDGWRHEQILFANAEYEGNDARQRQIMLRHARTFADQRREHIEAVRRGDYAEYGVTEADIVE